MLTRFAIAVVVALFNLATAPTANASPYAVLHQDDSTLIDNAEVQVIARKGAAALMRCPSG
jgi:hypothetical protein